MFLNWPLGQSPEHDLSLQVQGIVAEYERAKIMERSRRGKKHAAQNGSLNVMANAPFGYRYVSVREGGGQARFEPVAEQARIVQQIFSWIGRDRCSLAEVCRRLQKAEPASFHLGLKIEHTKHLHAVERDCIFFVRHTDVAKAQGFNR